MLVASITTPKHEQEPINNEVTVTYEEDLKTQEYAYEHLLEELKTTTTTILVKKTNYKNEEKSCPQFEELFKEYGLEPVNTFSYIAWRESRCRPKAVNATWDKDGNVTWTLNKNGSIDRGLFQINSSWKTVTSKVCKSDFNDMDVLFTLDCNLKVAKYLLNDGGLGHWGM